MKSVLAPWLSHSSTSTTKSSQRRVVCNGIPQFPVWMSVPDDVQHRGTLHSHCLEGIPGKQATSSPDAQFPSSSVRSASPPPLWLGSGGSSDDSDGPVSRRARRLAIYMAKKNQRAAKAQQESLSPPPLLSGSEDSSDDSDDGLPPANQDPHLHVQDVDVHRIDTGPVDLLDSSPRSLQDSSSDNLDDFIDKSEPAYTLLQQKTLMRFFPITCKHLLNSGV